VNLLDLSVICAAWLGIAAAVGYFTARFIAVANRGPR